MFSRSFVRFRRDQLRFRRRPASADWLAEPKPAQREKLTALVERWPPVRLLLEDRHPQQWDHAVTDAKSQIEHLFRGDFLIEK